MDWAGWAAILLALFLAGFSAIRSYGDDHAAIDHRVTATEQRVMDIDRRLERIENKLDQALLAR
jgi:hypothetical protein